MLVVPAASSEMLLRGIIGTYKSHFCEVIALQLWENDHSGEKFAFRVSHFHVHDVKGLL